MIERISIRRESIKIRKAIQKDFCTCWNTTVLDIDGNPCLICGDRTTYEELEKFYSECNSCTSVYFSQDLSECRNKIELTLKYKLPVVLKINQVIPEDLIKKMGEVPHSAIHVPIGFLNESARNLLEKNHPSVKDLRKMMFVAKSLKVFVAVLIDYQPLIMKKLDILEMIEMTKMLSSHVIVNFKDVLDVDLYTKKDIWSAIKPGYDPSDVHRYYDPVYETRSWRLKDKVKREFITVLKLFVKSKKMNIEPISLPIKVPNRIRHTSSKNCELPMGIRPFYYTKIDELFVENPDLEECICSRCGKSIFN